MPLNSMGQSARHSGMLPRKKNEAAVHLRCRHHRRSGCRSRIVEIAVLPISTVAPSPGEPGRHFDGEARAGQANCRVLLHRFRFDRLSVPAEFTPIIKPHCRDRASAPAISRVGFRLAWTFPVKGRLPESGQQEGGDSPSGTAGALPATPKPQAKPDALVCWRQHHPLPRRGSPLQRGPS